MVQALISFRVLLAAVSLMVLFESGGAAIAKASGAAPPNAATQATHPSREQRDDSGRRSGQERSDRPEGDRGGSDGPSRGGPPRGMWTDPTQEQWEEALTFLRENSPRRMELFDKALDEWRRQQQGPITQAELPRSIRGARARIFGRVQMLRMIERGDPELYDLALQQFRLEDQIIGALHDAREARSGGDEARATEASQRAQEAVGRYAEGTILEREQRIKRMREELAREEQRLQEDRNQMERLVERLLERFRRSVPGGQGSREGGSEGQRGGGERGDGEGDDSSRRDG